MYKINGIESNENVILMNEDDEKVQMSIRGEDDDDELISQHKESMADMMKNGQMPIFFKWNDDIERLIKEFQDENVIKMNRKKIVTLKSQMVYDYNHWED